MSYKKIDGHLHMHYGFAPTRWIPDDYNIVDGFEKIKEIRKAHDLEKIVSVFAPIHKKANKEIMENNFIYSGIYIHIEDNYEPIVDESEDFKFILLEALGDPINPLVEQSSDYSDKLSEIIDYSSSKGFKKFQLHTHGFDEKHLETLKKLIKDDRVFYLVNGLQSIYWNMEYWESKIKPKDLLELESNLLLGTSDMGTMTEIPHKYLKQALDDGLEDMICFESDLIFNTFNTIEDIIKFYNGDIERVEKAVGYNKKIFQENIKLFLE